MASLKAKIGIKSPRKRENKNYHFVSFRSYSMRNRKVHKNSKKIQKIKKRHYGDISSQNRSEKDEKDRNQKLSFRSVPTRRVMENSKKIAKKFRKFKNINVASLKAKIGIKSPRKRENKNYNFVSFLSDA